MTKRFLILLVSLVFFIFSNPSYSKEISPEFLDKYIRKISNKFSRTYCNTSQFGISTEGSLAFAIGETNKEFKNNKLNKFIDYSILKNSIVDNLESNCQVYDFPILSLDKLAFE